MQLIVKNNRFVENFNKKIKKVGFYLLFILKNLLEVRILDS